MRLIDADKFEINLCNLVMGDIRDYPEGTWSDFFGFLDNAPTVADVRENVRGEWIGLCDGSLECSVCGGIAPYNENYYGDVICAPRYNFCPNCGAQMEEV